MKSPNQDILIDDLIANHGQQLHRSKWTSGEDTILLEAITHNWSIQEIKTKAVKLRTESAIFTRANHHGFGYKTNKDDGQIYFCKDINHKNRRTKEEMLAELGKVPTTSAKAVEDCDKKSTASIPKKDKISDMIYLLIKAQKSQLNLLNMIKDHL